MRVGSQSPSSPVPAAQVAVSPREGRGEVENDGDKDDQRAQAAQSLGLGNSVNLLA